MPHCSQNPPPHPQAYITPRSASFKTKTMSKFKVHFKRPAWCCRHCWWPAWAWCDRWGRAGGCSRRRVGLKTERWAPPQRRGAGHPPAAAPPGASWSWWGAQRHQKTCGWRRCAPGGSRSWSGACLRPAPPPPPRAPGEPDACPPPGLDNVTQRQ